jgi:hypothetical protein
VIDPSGYSSQNIDGAWDDKNMILMTRMTTGATCNEHCEDQVAMLKII